MKIFIAAMIGFALSFAVTVHSARASAAEKAGYWTHYCCDAYGDRVCNIGQPVQDGTPCYCNYLGTGYAC